MWRLIPYSRHGHCRVERLISGRWVGMGVVSISSITRWTTVAWR